MDNSIRTFAILGVVALAFTPTTSTASRLPPDLCEEPVLKVDGSPYQDSTGLELSRWCEPRVDPPAWDGSVCCVVTDEANCVPPTSRGTCAAGMQFRCEYGEVVGDGVACYQKGPDACELGACLDVENPNGMTVFEGNNFICCEELNDELDCSFAGSLEPDELPEFDCGGFLAICNHGMTNADGGITCLEW